MRTEAMFCAVAVLAVVSSSRADFAGVHLDGRVWTGGSSPEGFASVQHAVSSGGGTGGGTTSSGFGRFELTVQDGAIRLTGGAEHAGYVDYHHGQPQGQSFHGVLTQSQVTGAFEGILLTLDREMEFTLADESHAQSFDAVAFPISPVAVVPVSGARTDLGDGRVLLSEGTYRLEVYLLAYNAAAPFVPSWQNWVGYDRHQSVHKAVLDWSMTPVLPPVHPCDGDMTGDGVVDGLDVTAVLAGWGACPAGQACTADLDGDGVVNGADITVVLAGWGPCIAGP